MGLLDLSIFDDVRRMNKRQVYYQVLTISMVVASALMLWKSLILLSYSESPLVVVLSGSMEPAFYRGDVLYLTNNPDEPIRTGDITVFKVEGREIPIVHRVITVHKSVNGSVKFLTKGDNNPVHDRGLYAPGQDWLEPSHVLGRAKGFIPHIGQVTIVMNDNPKLKVYASRFTQEAEVCIWDTTFFSAQTGCGRLVHAQVSSGCRRYEPVNPGTNVIWCLQVEQSGL